MDANRKQELRASLEGELESETDLRRFSAGDRLCWLSDRLEEYVERWLGFCDLSEANVTQLVDSVLFGMIEIGTEVLTKELQSTDVPPNLRVAWQRFQSGVKAVRSSAAKDDAPQLRSLLSAWRSLVSSTVG